MNNQSERDRNSYNTNRSDRYRNPENRNEMRFDDYGSPARGGYGNEGRMGTFGNQGNEMGGSRNRGNDSTYSSSRNFGNMGSYGGAQGFGSSRGGYPQQRSHDDDMRHAFDSGMGPMGGMSNNQTTNPGMRSHGYESDFDSHGGSSRVRDVSYRSNNDLYGSDLPRRFQGSDQNRYHFDSEDFNRQRNFGNEPDFRGRNDRPGGSYSYERFNSPTERNRGYRGGHGPSEYGDSRDRAIRDYDRY